MKIKRFSAAILALAVLFLTLLVPTFAVPADAVYGAEKQPTVVLPENRFADFEFVKNPSNRGVLIRIFNLDDRVTYEEFEDDVILKTAGDVSVPFTYEALDSFALIGFDLPDETVYLTLSDRLNALPPPTLSAPAVYTAVPLSVDPDSYKAAAKSVRSGTVFLMVTSLEENAEFTARAANIFDGFAIREEYHFKLELTHRKLDAEEAEPLYYGSEGKVLKLRIRLPAYDKKSKYAIVTDLGTHINAKTVPVDTSSGFATVEFEIARNGSFAIVAYATRNLPWWAILLIVAGCAAVACVPAAAALIKRKKKAKAKKSKKRDSLPWNEETETKDFNQDGKDCADTGKQTDTAGGQTGDKENAGGQEGETDTGDECKQRSADPRGSAAKKRDADGAAKSESKDRAGAGGTAEAGASETSETGADGASARKNSGANPKKPKSARGAESAQDKTGRADENTRAADGGTGGEAKPERSE